MKNRKNSKSNSEHVQKYVLSLYDKELRTITKPRNNINTCRLAIRLIQKVECCMARLYFLNTRFRSKLLTVTITQLILNLENGTYIRLHPDRSMLGFQNVQHNTRFSSGFLDYLGMMTVECRSIWILLQQEIVELAMVTTRTLRRTKLQSNTIIPIVRFLQTKRFSSCPTKIVRELRAENRLTGQQTTFNCFFIQITPHRIPVT